MKPLKALPKVGDKHNRFTVERVYVIPGIDWRSDRTRIDCRCDCGKLVEGLEAYRVVGEHKRSCGCLRSDNGRAIGKRGQKHGYRAKGFGKCVEYTTWVRIRSRCGDPTNSDYSGYGGRGITVCDRWQTFENFLSDMGKRPVGKSSIDRINNDGNYEPGNCRWATVKQQNRNKRTIWLLTIDGVTRPMCEWAEAAGINLETVRTRLNRGWDPKEAVFGEIRQKMERVGNRWGKR